MRWEIIRTATPLAAVLLDQRQQAAGRRLRERAGRLVEDQQLRRRGEGAGDLDHLLQLDVEVADDRRLGDVDADPLQHLAGVAAQRDPSRRGRPRSAAGRGRCSRRPRVGARVSSWLMLTIAEVEPLARVVDRRSARLRSRSSPPSGLTEPLITRARVDLPEPFSPVSACTSPARIEKSTSERATTPGKSTVIPSTAINGRSVTASLPSGCVTERSPKPFSGT